MKTPNIRMALAVLALPVVIISACQDRYRYPCQDPEMWNTEQCQKPACEISRSCPEHIFLNKQ